MTNVSDVHYMSGEHLSEHCTTGPKSHFNLNLEFMAILVI